MTLRTTRRHRTHGITEFGAAAAILDQLGRSTGDLGVLNLLDEIAPMRVAGS